MKKRTKKKCLFYSFAFWRIYVRVTLVFTFARVSFLKGAPLLVGTSVRARVADLGLKKNNADIAFFYITRVMASKAAHPVKFHFHVTFTQNVFWPSIISKVLTNKKSYIHRWMENSLLFPTNILHIRFGTFLNSQFIEILGRPDCGPILLHLPFWQRPWRCPDGVL